MDFKKTLDIIEIKKNSNYLKVNIANKKIVSFIIGGPNSYYDFSEKEIDQVFSKI